MNAGQPYDLAGRMQVGPSNPPPSWMMIQRVQGDLRWASSCWRRALAVLNGFSSMTRMPHAAGRVTRDGSAARPVFGMPSLARDPPRPLANPQGEPCTGTQIAFTSRWVQPGGACLAGC